MLREQKGHDGRTGMEHICELVCRLLEEKKKNSSLSEYKNLECLSSLIKRKAFVYKEAKDSKEVV